MSTAPPGHRSYHAVATHGLMGEIERQFLERAQFYGWAHGRDFDDSHQVTFYLRAGDVRKCLPKRPLEE